MAIKIPLPGADNLKGEVEKNVKGYKGNNEFGLSVDAERTLTLGQVQHAMSSEEFRSFVDKYGYVRFGNIDPQGGCFVPMSTRFREVDPFPHTDNVLKALFCSGTRPAATLLGPREEMIDLLIAFYRERLPDIFDDETIDALRVNRRLFLYGVDNGAAESGLRTDPIGNLFARKFLSDDEMVRSLITANPDICVDLQKLLVAEGAVSSVGWDRPNQLLVFSRLPFHMRACSTAEDVGSRSNLLTPPTLNQ